MEASLWTDAQVVVGPDGMARVIPLPRAAEPQAGREGSWRASVVERVSDKVAELMPFTRLSVPIADIGANVANAVAIAPAVPASNCEQCGEEVAGDYSGRRRHVFERHAFKPETTKLATQEALKKAIGECFPQAVVRNDLMVGS
jgi:hypothetical protein